MIIWLASYPKTGNTWMRSFLISLMIKNKDGLKLKDLENIRQFPTKKQYVNLGINIDFNNFEAILSKIELRNPFSIFEIGT